MHNCKRPLTRGERVEVGQVIQAFPEPKPIQPRDYAIVDFATGFLDGLADFCAAHPSERDTTLRAALKAAANDLVFDDE
mgnify:CR=1 FL=1